jgi:hypothetical protein
VDREVLEGDGEDVGAVKRLKGWKVWLVRAGVGRKADALKIGSEILRREAGVLFHRSYSSVSTRLARFPPMPLQNWFRAGSSNLPLGFVSSEGLADPQAARFDDREGRDEEMGMLAKSVADEESTGPLRQATETDEHDPLSGETLTEDQVPKVLVGGEEKGTLRDGTGQNVFIG